MDGLIAGQQDGFFHATIQTGATDVARAIDVRLSKLMRIIFTQRNMLECRRMDHEIDTLEGKPEAFDISDITQKITDVVFTESFYDLLLKVFVAGKNADMDIWMMDAEVYNALLTKKAGTPCDADGSKRKVEHVSPSREPEFPSTSFRDRIGVEYRRCAGRLVMSAHEYPDQYLGMVHKCSFLTSSKYARRLDAKMARCLCHFGHIRKAYRSKLSASNMRASPLVLRHVTMRCCQASINSLMVAVPRLKVHKKYSTFRVSI